MRSNVRWRPSTQGFVKRNRPTHTVSITRSNKVSKDIFEKCRTNGGYFGEFRARGDRFFTRPILDPHPSNRMIYEGSEKIMWSVNNYLGLAGNEEVQKAASDALKEYGIHAPMGARMMSGNTDEHVELEKQLAQFAEKEASILFNYGYLGVIGTVDSLTENDDVIIVDKLAHACIVDAAKLAQAQLRVFRHNDMGSLESVLKHVNRNRKGGVMIVTEGTYGMTGDLAKLKEISELKEKYDARLVIDDAHGVGVLGDQGRGTASHFGVQDKIDIYFGTFAKSFAAIGGFSATDRDVVEWMTFNARTQVFAKSLPLIYVKAMQKALELVMKGDDRREALWKKSNSLKQGLEDLGFAIGPGESPICSVLVPVGEGEVTTIGAQMVKYLRDNGVFVTAVVYPVIPLGLCMFRMIPTVAHTEADIAETHAVFKKMREDLSLTLDLDENDREKVAKVYGRKI